MKRWITSSGNASSHFTASVFASTNLLFRTSLYRYFAQRPQPQYYIVKDQNVTVLEIEKLQTISEIQLRVTVKFRKENAAMSCLQINQNL